MRKRRFSVFTGSGSALPTRRIENREFAERRFFLDYGRPLDPVDNPRIVQKLQDITGITERRYAADDVLASDLGAAAAARALDDAGTDPETLDYIVVAHNFGDVRPCHARLDLVPTLAARIKEKLRIRNPG
jgi:3-oxoacyl-[acyl-carrier-protein] synthase-3